MNDEEDWKRYRDDSSSISLQTCKEREFEKTIRVNENIVKDKIKYTMEYNQDEMLFLDTKIDNTNSSKTNSRQKSCYRNRYALSKTDTHQYLSSNSCHRKNQTKNIPIGLADRMRRSCSNNIINDITYRKRLTEYKPYLMKFGHSEKDIDQAFCKRPNIPRTVILKKKSNRKQNNKIKFITEYELIV